MRSVGGLHHITAIAGPAQENLDFYAGVLGMRLVKKSVNQDDPGTYHLFYADAAGHPGSDLTFFPWSRMAPPARRSRLEHRGVARRAARFARLLGASSQALRRDHRRTRTAIRTPDVARRRSAWPAARARGECERLDARVRAVGRKPRPGRATGARARERTVARARPDADDVLSDDGSRLPALSVPRARGTGTVSATGGSGSYVDIQAAVDVGRGAWGIGSVHHLAWRVEDEAHQLDVRQQVDDAAAGRRRSSIGSGSSRSTSSSRAACCSSLATDGPGFGVDEDPAHLGESLVLPPWLEPQRAAIEQVLPRLRSPIVEISTD